MAHGPARDPSGSAHPPLTALYLCLIVAPVIAHALVITVAPQLPWTTRATIFVLAGLTLLTLARRIGRATLIATALGLGLAILILSGTLIAAAVAAAVVLAAFASGSVVLRLVRPAGLQPAEAALYAVALGLGVTSYMTLALGLGGLLVPWAAVLVIAVPVVLARGEILAAAEALCRAWSPVSGPARPMLAAGTVWAIMVLVHAVAPETGPDSISYHLGLPRVWIDAGRMVDVPEQIQSYYYLAMEINYTLAMLLAGPAAAKLLNLMCLALAVASVYFVGRSMFSARPATVAAVLFATTPMIARQGTTTFVDVAVILYVLLGSAATLRTIRTRDPRLAIMAGLLLGLAVATKLTALFAVAPILVFAGASMLVSAGTWRPRVTALAAGGMAFAAALAPWPLLRYIQTGNPVFPLLNDVFRSPLWPQAEVLSNPAYSLEGYGLGKDPAAILATPFALSYTAERFDDGAFGTAFGIVLLLVPLALIGRRRSEGVRYLALISGAAFVVWALTIPYARYLLPAFGAFMVLAGVGLDDLSRSASRMTARIAILVPTLLMIAALPLAAGRIPYAVALGIESREAYLSRSVPSYDPLRLVASSTGRESRVLLLSFYEGGWSQDEDRLYAPGHVEATSSLWTQDLLRITDHAVAIAAIRDRGFTHVYIDRRYVDPRARDAAVVDPAFLREHATLEYEKSGVELHKVR